MFRYAMISTRYKPTRVTTSKATAINYIITKAIADSDFKTAVLKSFISA